MRPPTKTWNCWISLSTKWLVVLHTGIQLSNDAANKRSICSYLLTSAYVQTHMTCKRQYKETASLAGLVIALWIAEGLLWQPLFIVVQIPRLILLLHRNSLPHIAGLTEEDLEQMTVLSEPEDDDRNTMWRATSWLKVPWRKASTWQLTAPYSHVEEGKAIENHL